MPIDGRIEELLARYPDQLDDAELAELRAAGERDPEVEQLMDRLHEVEGLLGPGSDALISASAALSPGGERALQRTLDDVDASVVTDRSRVVQLQPRSGRWRAGWTALAAMLLLGISVVLVIELEDSGRLDEGGLLPGSAEGLGAASDLQLRGDVPDLTGNLEFESSAAVVQGMGRPLDQSVVFVVLVSLPAHLALLETLGGETHVLHPSAGGTWRLEAGTHRVEPRPGASAYRPAMAGDASYALVGSPSPIQVPGDGLVASVTELISANEGAVLLDERAIRWTAVE